MRGLKVLSVIAMLFASGETFECVKGNYMGYPSADDTILLTEVCDQRSACVLAIISWSNGALSTRRGCAQMIHAVDFGKSVTSNATVESLTAFYCHTDYCNQTPPANPYNHAQSISPNSIILFLTSCTLLFAMKNVH